MTVSVMYSPDTIDRYPHKEIILPKQPTPLIIQRKPISLNRIITRTPFRLNLSSSSIALYIEICSPQSRLSSLKAKQISPPA